MKVLITKKINVELFENIGHTEDRPNELCKFGCLTGNFAEVVGPETVDLIDSALGDKELATEGTGSVFSLPGNMLYENNISELLDSDMEVIEGEKYHTIPCTDNRLEFQSEQTFFGELVDEDIEIDRNIQMTMETENEMDISYSYEYTSKPINYHTEHEVQTLGASKMLENQSFCPNLQRDLSTEPNKTEQAEQTNIEDKESLHNMSIMRRTDIATFAKILHDLQNDPKCLAIHDWLHTDIGTLVSYCANKNTMNKHLQKREVYVCAKSIEQHCSFFEVNVLSTLPKYRILSMLFDMSEEQLHAVNMPKKKRKLQVESLKDIT